MWKCVSSPHLRVDIGRVGLGEPACVCVLRSVELDPARTHTSVRTPPCVRRKHLTRFYEAISPLVGIIVFQNHPSSQTHFFFFFLGGMTCKSLMSGPFPLFFLCLKGGRTRVFTVAWRQMNPELRTQAGKSPPVPKVDGGQA